MASERKIAANRRNAQKSTGPRSDAGKKTLKPQCVSPWPRRRGRAFRGCAAQSEALAREIADASTNSVLVATDPEVLAFARLAALAELDFAHIRALRACNISALAAAADWPVAVFSQGAGATAASSATLVLNEREVSSKLCAALISDLQEFDRCERRAIGRCDRAMLQIIARGLLARHQSNSAKQNQSSCRLS